MVDRPELLLEAIRAFLVEIDDRAPGDDPTA
jgi:hypothetical protein